MLMHGHGRRGKHTPTYTSWLAMKRRCNDPNNNRYYRYGGRGIKVCDRWNDPESGFINFLEDMGEKPEGASLDRIGYEGDYCPENCRWADAETQAQNKSTTHGFTKSKTWNAWVSMRQRARKNVESPDYDPEWEDFKVFLTDMGEMPNGYRLDRKDKNKPHGIGNSFWRKKKETVRLYNNKTYDSWLNMRRVGKCSKEWESFDIFLRDMGERPEGKMLRKINCLLPHSKENSYWAIKDIKGRGLQPTRLAWQQYKKDLFGSRWQTFDSFYEEMGKKKEDEALAVIDKNLPISPDNLEWRKHNQSWRP